MTATTNANVESPQTEQAWIKTYTGKKFYLYNPTSEMICIEDISHALANKCRFAGHSKHFYSVAQHSVLVADIVMSCLTNVTIAQTALYGLHGLLHDAAEAYLPDVVRPLKVLFPLFIELEHRILRIIHQAMNVPFPSPDATAAIKSADNIALATEGRDLMGGTDGWAVKERPREYLIESVDPIMSEAIFTQRWRDITEMI